MQVLSEESPTKNPTTCTCERTFLDYIERLEEKVRFQAGRLSELEQIKLNSQRSKSRSPIRVNNNDIKDDPNYVSIKKYNILQNKFVKLTTEFNDLKNIKNKRINLSSKFRNEIDFQDVEKFQNIDKLKDTYKSLLSNYKELIVEKEEILESLRDETVTSEEQRNLIEVLKQALENELINSGMISKYLTIDNVIDFSKLKLEAEKYKRELINSQSLLTNFQQELEEIKSQNLTLTKNKEKVRRTLDEGVREMELCREKTRDLELHNFKLEEQLSLLNQNYNRVCKERDELIGKMSILKNKLTETSKSTDDQREMLMTRLNEYRKNYDRLNLDFEEILREKTKTEIENSKLIEQNIHFKEKLENTLSKYEESNSQTLDKRTNELSLSMIHLNYKKLYEELAIEFEEYKNSQKKISNQFLKKLKQSFNKSSEELYEEHLQLSKENNRLTIEVQKYEINIETIKKKIEELELDYNKYVRLYENEAKNSKGLLNEKKKLEEESEKLREDVKFYREKYEKDCSNKIAEIKNSNDEISSLKVENRKLNDSIKDFKLQKNEKEDVIDELNSKIESQEKLIKNLSEREEKLTQILNDFNEVTKSHSDLKHNYYEVTRREEMLNKALMELGNEKENLTEKLINSERGVKNVEVKFNEKVRELEGMRHKMDAIESEKRKLTLVNDDLQAKLKENEAYSIEKDNEIEYLDNALKEYEIQNQKLTQEIEMNKKDNEEAQKMNKILQDFIADVKICLYSLHSHLKVSVHKFNSYANEDLNSLLTKNFSQNLVKLLKGVNTYTTEANEVDILSLTTEYIKVLSNEFENCYDKLIDSNNYIKEAQRKVFNLENSLNEISKQQVDVIEKEKKFKIALKTIENENKEQEIKHKEMLDEYVKEINYLIKEREESFNDLKKYKNDGYSSTCKIEKLIKENQDLVEENNHLNENLLKLENKSKNILKEKRYTEGLLLFLIKSYPCKDVVKCMNEIISINEFIFRTENEKSKIEEKLSIMEKEYKILSEDKSCHNTDLSTIVKNEQENLKKLVKDYDRKIKEKKENQKKIENEIYNYEKEVKANYEKGQANELKIKKLQKELDGIKMEANVTNNQYKSRNNVELSNNNCINKTAAGNTQKNVNTGLVEILSLESNYFSENFGKNKKETEVILTNYNTIELELSDDTCIKNEKSKTTPVFTKEVTQELKASTRRENIDKINTITLESNLNKKQNN